MTCFSSAVPMVFLVLRLSIFMFIFVLFNLYFRQVFCFNSILFVPLCLVSIQAENVGCLTYTLVTNVCVCVCVWVSARVRHSTIKINSTSLFFNSNFICLFMLFTSAFFYCEIAIDRRISANPSVKRVSNKRLTKNSKKV